MGEAWLKAVAEGFGVYRWLRQQTIAHPDRERPEPDSIESFDEHMLFYACAEQAGLASFLDASPERRPTREVPPLEGAGPRSQIEALVERLARRGVSAYAADVTSPDVRLAGAQRGARRRSELCALDVSQRARFLGGTRLYARRLRGRSRPGTAPASPI